MGKIGKKSGKRNSKNGLFLGASSVFDIAGSSRSEIKIGGHRSDAKALRSDWQKIGNDIRMSMSQKRKK